jgi:hypothetical protein
LTRTAIGRREREFKRVALIAHGVGLGLRCSLVSVDAHGGVEQRADRLLELWSRRLA